MVSSISWWRLLLLPVFLGEEWKSWIFVASTVNSVKGIWYPISHKKYEVTNMITIIVIIKRSWQDIFGQSWRFSWKNPAREVSKTLHETYIETNERQKLVWKYIEPCVHHGFLDMAHMIGKTFLGILNVFHGRILQEKFARSFMQPTLESEQLDGTLKHQRSHGVSKTPIWLCFFSFLFGPLGFLLQNYTYSSLEHWMYFETLGPSPSTKRIF